MLIREIMNNRDLVIIGDSTNMKELENGDVQLVVTSPPYFNAPFDYEGFYSDYGEYKRLMQESAEEIYRVLEEGRIVSIVCDDMLVDSKKYPVVADLTKIFLDVGFDYRDKIIWKKPDGYVRISRRSGVLLQNPYPMYFYPDNIEETILILQKGEFEYSSISNQTREKSKIDVDKFQEGEWYKTVWEITNVLPRKERVEKGIAAFPEEIPRRLITLFSYVGETVLDPFLGSGTTMKVARELERDSIGYEINKIFLDNIKKKLGQKRLNEKRYSIDFKLRDDAISYEPPV